MSRRVSLPGAAELFRVTGDGPEERPDRTVDDPADRDAGGVAGAGPTGGGSDDDADVAAARSDVRGDLRGDVRAHDRIERRITAGPVAVASPPGDWVAEEDDVTPAPRPVRRRVRAGERRPTGRERHDEKITVYCSPEELLDLEHARLTLRGEFGLAVDRGRIVREAMAVVLADLDAKGESSILVRRLRGRA